MRTLLILGIFLSLGLLLLGLTEWQERRKKSRIPEGSVADSAAESQPQRVREPVDDECCGTHAVCEREMLLQKSTEVEYFDDEELDLLAGRSPLDYTESENQELEEVFYSLRERDVAGWLRSLQSRNIQLPENLKEQALFIVSERRRVNFS